MSRTVLVLGASGRLGRHLVAGLLDRGLGVRAFIHVSNALAHPQLTLYRGDVRDGRAVAGAVDGASAVLAALGSADAATKDVASGAMRHLVASMRAAGLRRIVSATGSAAWRDQERASPHPNLRVRREQLMRAIPELVIDGEAHLRILERSNLDWTVIRAPLMRGEPSDRYTLSVDPPEPGTVSSYLAAATAMIDQLTSDEWVRAAPFVR